MSKIQYIPMKRFREDSLAKIAFANEVLEDLTSRGYTPTLRQVYYRFVAADKIPNTQREYKNLGNLLNDARLCGLIDWTHMIDRTRNIQSVSHWSSLEDIIDSCADCFRIDKWVDQPNYVEVWVEKDAQIDVVGTACEPLDVPYFSCRGYVSQSEMWGAAMRIFQSTKGGRWRSLGSRNAVVIHLGDHDPSGIDMTRDITDRMALFGVNNVEIRRIALNMPQIEELGPPPNPAKITDSRAAGYIAEYGDDSWELDALDPDYTNNLITEQVDELRDDALYAVREEEEREHRDHLAKIRDNWHAVVDFIEGID